MYQRLPDRIYSQLDRSNTVLLQTNKFTDENFESLLFQNPKFVLTQTNQYPFQEILKDIEVYLKDGFYAAGYVSYEAVSAKSVKTILPTTWFGIYEEPWRFDHRVRQQEEGEKKSVRSHELKQVTSNFSFAGSKNSEFAYKRGVETVLKHIARGDSYQINLCGQFDLELNVPPELLYRCLLDSFPSPYSAYISTQSGYVISLSPELFFSLEGQNITIAPMKGTAARGKTLIEDTQIASALAKDEKSQAENVMIVDLMRNDLTKIASNVTVRDLFKVEKFLTLFQMTSVVAATLKLDVGYGEIFKALFPSGSITGAPKQSSMEIIKNIEQAPRGVYTGAIGYFAPNNRAKFSIAIRTIEGSGRAAKIGIGSGIVWDSKPQTEFEECLLKGNFITSPIEEFTIFETMLLDGSYQNLNDHLERLKESAKYFDYPLDLELCKTRLAELPSESGMSSRLRVKLSLDRFGAIDLSYRPVVGWESDKIAIWPQALSSKNRFLYHKTSLRKEYDLATLAAQKEGLADYIFVNEREEVTEGAISNIFIRTGESHFTPPLNSGLLAGVCRNKLLQTLKNCSEQVIKGADLLSADEILICNSVRGVTRVTLSR